MYEDEQRSPEEQRQDEPEPASAEDGETGQPKAPPDASPAPAPVKGVGNTGGYLLGLGLGLLPAFAVLISTANPLSFLGVLCLAGIFYLIEIVAMALCLTIKKSRMVGYGLLTAVLISPIIVGIACSVLPNGVVP